jgi:S-(hydroxymethyl)glutathione dehydrogenase/alcohol dehydrogenase
MTRVRAAVGDGRGNFSIEDVEIDEPQGQEVLIAIRASGVCHTDWDSLRWGRPLILGHEGAGQVLRVGPNVTTCQSGDRVMLNWAIPCGDCFQCERGKENICEDRGTVSDLRFHLPGNSADRSESLPQTPARTGMSGASAGNTGSAGPGGFNASFSLGTMATHALVPQAAVVALPDDVPFEVGAILGCAVMTGFGSAVNAAQVSAGSTVVVLGCGGVGLSVILGAVYCKAARILAIDLNPERLALAMRFGATEILLADRGDADLCDAIREVKHRTHGRGADYAFECTAVAELGSVPLAMARSGGTAVGVSGIEQVVPVNMELFEWDKIYINPLYGSCRPQRDFPKLLDLYREGKLPLDQMVTRTYSLDALAQAFHEMRAGINAKGVLLFD